MQRRLIVAAVFVLAATAGIAGANPYLRPRPTQVSHAFRATNPDCPPYAGGTGILADGDFSQAPDPGNGSRVFSKRQDFAPDWRVKRGSIWFYGSTAWNGGPGYCSLNLDAYHRGTITHSAVRLMLHKQYTLTFLLSGDSACNGKRSNSIKALNVKVGEQWKVFVWDTAHGNDVQHGVWGAESFTFEATRPRALIHFRSMDWELNHCGPVLAAMGLVQD